MTQTRWPAEQLANLQHPKRCTAPNLARGYIFSGYKSSVRKAVHQRACSHVHIAHTGGSKSLLVMRLTSFFPLPLTPAVATSARYICQDNRAFRRHGSTIYRLSGTIMPRLEYSGFCTAPPADIVSSLWTSCALNVTLSCIHSLPANPPMRPIVGRASGR